MQDGVVGGKMVDKIGYAVPSIPPRADLLKRALDSIASQTYPVSSVAVAYDFDHRGAGYTRNRAKNMILADPEITVLGLLDDDDTLDSNHVKDLLGTMRADGTDLVFSWFRVENGTDPIAELEHLPWNDATPHSFGITVLMTAEAARSTDFIDGAWEDWTLFNELLRKGFRFSHHYDRTWTYNHSVSVSGRGDRW